MEKDVYISIRSIFDCASKDKETMDFSTEGVFTWENDRGHLSYYETAVTGMAGTKTTLNIDPEGVTVDREGYVTSSMRFREGLKDTVFYTTPYGTAALGIDTRKIRGKLDPKGGSIVIDYVVSMDHVLAMRNKFILDIREQGESKGV